MTQPVDIEALRQLMARATAGPWAYRPQEHDDWGFIRTMIATEDGWHPVVARANDVSVHEDHDAHRAAKTDPAEGNARLIVAAVNALPSLLTELEALRAERGRMVERRKFPILGGQGASIDYQLVADHGKQARENHYQTVERLAERGGLSWSELFAVLHNRKWQRMDNNEAILACRELEARYLAALKEPSQ